MPVSGYCWIISHPAAQRISRISTDWASCTLGANRRRNGESGARKRIGPAIATKSSTARLRCPDRAGKEAVAAEGPVNPAARRRKSDADEDQDQGAEAEQSLPPREAAAAEEEVRHGNHEDRGHRVVIRVTYH